MRILSDKMQLEEEKEEELLYIDDKKAMIHAMRIWI